jgi:hypothetical protein
MNELFEPKRLHARGQDDARLTLGAGNMSAASRRPSE